MATYRYVHDNGFTLDASLNTGGEVDGRTVPSSVCLYVSDDHRASKAIHGFISSSAARLLAERLLVAAREADERNAQVTQ